MFGRYAISKAPFAGQGSNAYFLSLTENSTLADADYVDVTFNVIYSAPMTSEDTNAEHAIFYFGNVDDMYTAQDTIDMDVNFPCSFSDGVTCDETVGISLIFVGTVDEAMASLDDAVIGSAYFDTYNEDSGLTDTYAAGVNTSTAILEGLTVSDNRTITAHFAVSRSDAVAVAVHLETFGWIKIQTHTTSNWTPIDDEQ